MEFLVTEERAAQILSLSPETLRKWRSQERLTQGIHYHRVGRRIRYNPDLLTAWATEDTETHARTITRYLGNQPGNSTRNLRLERLKKVSETATA